MEQRLAIVVDIRLGMFHKLKVGIKSVENTFSKHETSKDARFESAYQRFCELEDKASLLANALRVRSCVWRVGIC